MKGNPLFLWPLAFQLAILEEKVVAGNFLPIFS
jgi:hypothetical protein